MNKNKKPQVLLTQNEDSKLGTITREQNSKLKTINPNKAKVYQFTTIYFIIPNVVYYDWLFAFYSR